MFNILTTIVACILLGASLPQIDGGYLYIASFALGAFILGVILALTITD
tara:strand:+ start:639 stop:785 length:147 start_codon:yes stop_codon:yes gene_type:complete